MTTFTAFARVSKSDVTKYRMNKLELAICAYQETVSRDLCLAINSEGRYYELSTNGGRFVQTLLKGFVNGWLYK